jgi:anti-sigma B factor antagonist
MRVRVRRPTSHAVVVAVAGEVDLGNAPRLAEILRARLAGAVELVVVDLVEVTFLAVAGLRTLLHARLLARGKGVDFYVDPGESHAVNRLFAIAPVDFSRPGVAKSVAALGTDRQVVG